MSFRAVPPNVVVLEIGSAYTKCGFAGMGAPLTIIPTSLVTPSGKKVSPLRLSRDCPAPTMAEWSSALREFLHTVFLRHLAISPTERPVVVVQDPLWPDPFRAALGQTLLTTMGVPSLVYIPSPLASLYPTGLTSGLVVDCGYWDCTVTPISRLPRATPAHSIPDPRIVVLPARVDIPLGAVALHPEVASALVIATNTPEVAPTPEVPATQSFPARPPPLRTLPAPITIQFPGVFPQGSPECETAGLRRPEADGEAASRALMMTEDIISRWLRIEPIGDEPDPRSKPITASAGGPVPEDEPAVQGPAPGAETKEEEPSVLSPGFSLRARSLCAACTKRLFVHGDPMAERTLVDALMECLNKCTADQRPLVVQNIVLVGGLATLPGFRKRFCQELRRALRRLHTPVRSRTPGPRLPHGYQPHRAMASPAAASSFTPMMRPHHDLGWSLNHGALKPLISCPAVRLTAAAIAADPSLLLATRFDPLAPARIAPPVQPPAASCPHASWPHQLALPRANSQPKKDEAMEIEFGVKSQQASPMMQIEVATVPPSAGPMDAQVKLPKQPCARLHGYFEPLGQLDAVLFPSLANSRRLKAQLEEIANISRADDVTLMLGLSLLLSTVSECCWPGTRAGTWKESEIFYIVLLSLHLAQKVTKDKPIFNGILQTLGWSCNLSMHDLNQLALALALPRDSLEICLSPSFIPLLNAWSEGTFVTCGWTAIC
ncbi:putative actin-related protein 10 [Paratrimastix pyriformis]|uniref:Actin-related protein 10 n=1 Tax=Paratrimastix pyriformis TaxID=342808 RepID=A0ABQ8U1D9_9EUKA|nr:putative actin-related protein 10 [Paratrimastix pyriformis]